MDILDQLKEWYTPILNKYDTDISFIYLIRRENNEWYIERDGNPVPFYSLIPSRQTIFRHDYIVFDDNWSEGWYNYEYKEMIIIVGNDLVSAKAAFLHEFSHYLNPGIYATRVGSHNKQFYLTLFGLYEEFLPLDKLEQYKREVQYMPDGFKSAYKEKYMPKTILQKLWYNIFSKQRIEDIVHGFAEY